MFLFLDKCWINRKQIFLCSRKACYCTFISHNIVNIFLVSHILLLFHIGSWNKSAKYEKHGKYWPYCTRNRAITNAYLYALAQLTRKEYVINHSFNCNDKCILYLLTSNKCKMQYVGKTVDGLRLRWNNYKDNNRKYLRKEACMQQDLFKT